MRLKRLICGLVAVNLALAVASSAGAQTVASLKGKNFSGGTTVTVASEYEGCNFSYQQAKVMANGTTIPTVINLATTATFRGCNFVNARPPEGSVCINCNTALVYKKLETGTKQLSAVDENGTTITKTIKTYSHVLYGWGIYTARTYTVNYLPSPRFSQARPPEGSRAERIQARYDEWVESQAAANTASAAIGGIE